MPIAIVAVRHGISVISQAVAAGKRHLAEIAGEIVAGKRGARAVAGMGQETRLAAIGCCTPEPSPPRISAPASIPNPTLAPAAR